MYSTLFEIFGIPIRSYGLMMVIGFALGLWRLIGAARAKDLSVERIYDLALIVLLSGIVGSRIVYVLLNPATESWPDILAVWNGGLSFHGGVVLALLGGYIYVRKTGLPFWTCADLFAPSLALAYAVTRIGCFLNGCCYGAPTNLPWGVRFMEGGSLTPPSHPTQIYAALANLAIFFILTRLEKLNRPAGFVFFCYLGLYGIYRFPIEFLRAGYSAQVSWLGLTQAQWVSLVMMVGAVIVLAIAFRGRQTGRDAT
jgi:phosphatidylglycerol:prolipoprotein diacylglycerol transferase